MGYVAAMGSVNGKVVFITGGARGIGAEVARRLRRRGAKLVLTDLDAAPLSALAAELGEEHVLTALADVRDLAAMQRAADAAVERFGGIDIVMANAGIACFGSVMQVDPEAFKRVIDINVVGVFNTVRATLPSVIERRGYVLVVSSLAAFTSAPGLAAYHASKAGAEYFANTLRLEVRPSRRRRRFGAHELDRHPAGAGRQVGPVGVPGDAVQAAAAAEPDHDRRRLWRGLRQGHRGTQETRIYSPSWVGAFRWIRPFVTTPLAERDIRKFTPTLLPKLDAEAAALGRSTSARIEALEKPEKPEA